MFELQMQHFLNLTADVFWVGFYWQALASLELSCEERKMKAAVPIGRLRTIILVLSCIPCRALSLSAVETGIWRCFRGLSCPPVAGSSQYQWYLLWPFDLNESILFFWCRASSDQGLTITGGSFQIKHVFLERTKGACKERHSRPSTYGRALHPLLEGTCYFFCWPFASALLPV